MSSDRKPEPPKLSAVEVQQEYYEIVGDADWELYTKKDRPYLLQKLAVAMCGPPTKEGNLKVCNELQGYEKRDESIIRRVYDKICEQDKYSHNKENILLSIVRVVCVTPKDTVAVYKFTPSDYWVDLHDKKDVTMWIFHIFCIRKCIHTKATTETGCRAFIDHDGRVYHTWEQYLTENNLPKCVMVVPENGEYKGILKKNISNDRNSSELMPIVKCSVVPSPALGLGVQVLAATDTVSTVANIGALVGIGTSLFVPVMVPVAVPVAMGVGVVTGVYGIVRATMNLVDRKTHEQSIGLGDSEARANWVNIMISTAGISAMGATKLLSWAAASGTNVKILMNAVTILQYANLSTGVLGVVNSLGDMIIKYTEYDETPTALELFQFTTSALFLGIGVMTNQTAQDIVQDAHAKTINDIRESLPSNVKKRMFDKVTAETRRVQGTVNGNSDVIKGLKNIENKNDFFAKLARMNKQMNSKEIRVSLSPDGKPLFNNLHKIEITELYGLGRSGRDVLFTNYGQNTNTAPNAPTRIYASNSTLNGPTWVQKLKSGEYNENIFKITAFLATLSKADQYEIAEILSDFTAVIHDTLIILCAEVIVSYTPPEIQSLNDPHYKVNIVIFIINYIKSMIPIDETDKELCFTNILKEFFVKGRIQATTILKIKKEIADHYYKLRKINNPEDFDDMFKFKKSNQYISFKAGEVLTIGRHDVFLKRYTVDTLEEWFAMYTQKKCDIFMNVCYRIISSLSSNEIKKLIEVNFDEDIIMRVSHFIYTEHNNIFEQMDLEQIDEDYLTDVSYNLKENLLEWRTEQIIRKYRTCEKCSGICFL